MQLIDLARLSESVAALRGRNAKIDAIAAVLADCSAEAIEPGARILSGELPDGRIGVGPSQLRAVRGTPTAEAPTLGVVELRQILKDIAAISGSGSKARRHGALVSLWAQSTATEQAFLGRLLFGELRQGAQQSLVVDAIAKATGIPRKTVRRAAMLSGDVGETARVAVTGGREALEAFRLRLFRPLAPMLASPCDGAEEALEIHPRVRVELKLDGARIQVHKDGKTVRVYTRQLNEVTAAVPEVVEAALALPAETLVLDGEAICLRPDGRPLPFQDTMRRFGRRVNVEALRADQPITPFYFDVLHADGEDLLDAPLTERAAVLDRLVPEVWRIESRWTDDAAVVQSVLDDAMARGHEGLIAKDPAAPWAAGARGKAWLKLKPAHTLDLVVLACEWGSGRRKGWLSNLHLGARDPDGGFVMLGKTFKGLTDELLAWQTTELLKRETRRTEWVVFVRPELVVEIAFNEVQASPRYPAGLALRFARVKGYRPDKSPLEADTLATVRGIFEAMRGTG